MNEIESKIIRRPDETTTIVKDGDKESKITQTPSEMTIEVK